MTKKEFFMGIDSDGTAFDSMTLKHRNAFIPKMIEIWGLEKHSEKVFEICEDINLYSKTRGIDRFSGLLVSFDRMKEEGIILPDYSPLKKFLEENEKLSNATLEEYIRVNDAPILNQVLSWSIEADAVFEEKVEKLMPFKPIVEILKSASEKADIAVISSASARSLEKDWQKEDLSHYLTAIYGQEQGKKGEQLKLATEGRYEQNKAVMLGDALGDYNAARSANIRFYPIIPGREEQSWLRFEEKYEEIFFSGRYDENCEKELMQEFYEALHMN